MMIPRFLQGLQAKPSRGSEHFDIFSQSTRNLRNVAAQFCYIFLYSPSSQVSFCLGSKIWAACSNDTNAWRIILCRATLVMGYLTSSLWCFSRAVFISLVLQCKPVLRSVLHSPKTSISLPNSCQKERLHLLEMLAFVFIFSRLSPLTPY